MGKKIDETNNRYGHLLVIEASPNKPDNQNEGAYWLCECDCGNLTTVSGSNLRRGKTKSCGCLAKE